MSFLKSIVATTVEIVTVIYLITAIIYLFRIVRGPTIFDRILAVDALNYNLTVFMALLALYLEIPMIALGMIVVSLWLYALDIYVSKYIEFKEIGE
ncbi:MAG: pH regulation protein F [Thermoprotei archaeon]|nr:MAG: pH regulation protein F [Thermoprotei archaeon]